MSHTRGQTICPLSPAPTVAALRHKIMAEFQFTFVCQKRFTDLEGADKIARFCEDCQKCVINFDRIEREACDEIIRIADAADLKLCVSATVLMRPSGPPCSELQAEGNENFGSVTREFSGLMVGGIKVKSSRRRRLKRLKGLSRLEAQGMIVDILTEQGSRAQSMLLPVFLDSETRG